MQQQQNIMDREMGDDDKANTTQMHMALKAPACPCTNCPPATLMLQASHTTINVQYFPSYSSQLPTKCVCSISLPFPHCTPPPQSP